MKQIKTDEAPQPLAPYSQAIHSGPFLFVSGQLGLDPKSGKLVSDSVEEQAKRALDSITAILKAAGTNWQSVVRVEIFLQDLNHFKQVNAIYEGYVTQEVKPARQAVEVARLPADGLVEISCIAELQ